jgi:hypothetical protein
VPITSPGATDARFFRALGTTAYGYGLFSERITYDDYGAMFTATTSASIRSRCASRPNCGRPSPRTC